MDSNNLLRCLKTWKSVTGQLKEAVKARDVDRIMHCLDLREEVLCLVQNMDQTFINMDESAAVLGEMQEIEKEVRDLLSGVVAETGDQLERARKAMSITVSLQDLEGGTRRGRLLDNYK